MVWLSISILSRFSLSRDKKNHILSEAFYLQSTLKFCLNELPFTPFSSYAYNLSISLSTRSVRQTAINPQIFIICAAVRSYFRFTHINLLISLSTRSVSFLSPFFFSEACFFVFLFFHAKRFFVFLFSGLIARFNILFLLSSWAQKQFLFFSNTDT